MRLCYLKDIPIFVKFCSFASLYEIDSHKIVVLFTHSMDA